KWRTWTCSAAHIRHWRREALSPSGTSSAARTGHARSWDAMPSPSSSGSLPHQLASPRRISGNGWRELVSLRRAWCARPWRRCTCSSTQRGATKGEITGLISRPTLVRSLGTFRPCRHISFASVRGNRTLDESRYPKPMEESMKSLRNKLMMCALVIVSLAGGANAAQRIVFEAPLENGSQQVSATFAVNRELGRAWVDVQVESPYQGEEPQVGEVISRAVEGLYYDPARKQVLYRTETENVVCAEDGKILWTTYLKNTGQCVLTARSEKRQIDDGFNIRNQTVATVAFEAKGGAPEDNALAEQLQVADISLEQGLAASAAEGKPISAKFELENGKLQLSVYVANPKSFSEVIVNHKTGKIAKAEAITSGEDLTVAVAQGEAMARARTSLGEALAKAGSMNQGYRAVAVRSALKDDRPIAYITLMKGENSKTISEGLD